jgi:hypothetical protein
MATKAQTGESPNRPAAHQLTADIRHSDCDRVTHECKL